MYMNMEQMSAVDNLYQEMYRCRFSDYRGFNDLSSTLANFKRPEIEEYLAMVEGLIGDYLESHGFFRDEIPKQEIEI